MDTSADQKFTFHLRYTEIYDTGQRPKIRAAF
jgi:hypothetical protein